MLFVMMHELLYMWEKIIDEKIALFKKGTFFQDRLAHQPKLWGLSKSQYCLNCIMDVVISPFLELC